MDFSAIAPPVVGTVSVARAAPAAEVEPLDRSLSKAFKSKALDGRKCGI
jgi:hypothetical protein